MNEKKKVVKKAKQVVALPELTNQEISKILDRAALVEEYLKAVKAEALARLIKKERIEGWKLGEGLGNRQWIDVKSVVKDFGYLGEDLYKKTLKSPADLSGLAGKQNLEKYVTRFTRLKIERAEETNKAYSHFAPQIVGGKS